VAEGITRLLGARTASGGAGPGIGASEPLSCFDLKGL